MSDQPVLIRLFFAKMKPEFSGLSQEEQAEFMARDRANLDALGMRAIVMIDCRGRDEEWDYIGVESWPSESAVKLREEFETNDLHISRYVEYKTHVGTGQSFEEYGKGGGKGTD